MAVAQPSKQVVNSQQSSIRERRIVKSWSCFGSQDRLWAVKLQFLRIVKSLNCFAAERVARCITALSDEILHLTEWGGGGGVGGGGGGGGVVGGGERGGGGGGGERGAGAVSNGTFKTFNPTLITFAFGQEKEDECGRWTGGQRRRLQERNNEDQIKSWYRTKKAKKCCDSWKTCKKYKNIKIY